MHVERADVGGPDQALAVVVRLGDHRHDAGDPDAVGAHRDGHEFSVLVEHLETEGLGVLAAELEHVADLHAARDLDRPRPIRSLVSRAHLGGLDVAVAREVAARDEPKHMLLMLVRPGDPLGTIDDTGIEK